MEECIFCKIVQGKSSCHKIYEDKNFLAFLDLYPFNPGHVLVIPKKHYRWVWQVKNAANYWAVANKIALVINKILKPETVLFITAGFEIPHAHIHLVPRFANDGHGRFLILENKKNIPETEMKRIANKLNFFIKRGGAI